MPKVDINEIETAVRENIKDADKAAQVIANLHNTLRAAEKEKANQPSKKKKFALIITSEQENTDGTITLIGHVTKNLEGLRGTASKYDQICSLTCRTTVKK